MALPKVGCAGPEAVRVAAWDGCHCVRKVPGCALTCGHIQCVPCRCDAPCGWRWCLCNCMLAALLGKRGIAVLVRLCCVVVQQH